MVCDTLASSAPSGVPIHRGRSWQPRALLAALAVVIVLDQATKWWGWRHVAGANINAGGDWLVGARIGEWYAKPATGALLDALDVGLLSIAGALLMRRRRPPAVFLTGAVVLAGWVSNLLDRLGAHYLTAPGSVRGAVDFQQIGHRCYNLADFFIIAATPLFLLAVGYSFTRPTTDVPTVYRRPTGARVRMSAAAVAVVLLGVVTLGAVNHDGVTTPVTSVAYE